MEILSITKQALFTRAQWYCLDTSMAEKACREIIQRLMRVPKPTVKDVNLVEMYVAQTLNLNMKPDEKGLLPMRALEPSGQIWS